MDGTIINVDFSNNIMHFAGANNTIYLIRDHELIQISGDRMPISYYKRMEDFINRDIDLKKGDMLYMFTDGYRDQFGGVQGKKFKTSLFKELLMNVHEESAREQKKILAKTFEEWKGDLEQVDDVTVIGIKI